MPKKLDKKMLRKRISEARKQKKINQAQLAKVSGVTPAAISQIEKGRRVPTLPVLNRISNVLGVSLDYLSGNTPNSELQDLLQHEELKKFYKGFQSLDPEDKETILNIVEIMGSKSKKTKKNDLDK